MLPPSSRLVQAHIGRAGLGTLFIWIAPDPGTCLKTNRQPVCLPARRERLKKELDKRTLQCKADPMEPNWATEHLQVIRTLMERSAIYRRALAPVMVLTGTVGLLAALGGWLMHIDAPRAFIAYWLSVSALPLVGSFLLVRRQALSEGEPLLSPPTRRVIQAILPAFLVGLVVSIAVLVRVGAADDPQAAAPALALRWMPIGWVILYGCAAHAAGFFMPRGIKLFGWMMLAGGCLLFVFGVPESPRPALAHGMMGLFFGAFHLAYGVYLRFTETRKNAA